MQGITSSLLYMSFLLWIVLILFATFIFKPASLLAIAIKAKQKGIKPSEVDGDEIWKLTIILCVPVYIFLWWLIEATGLRELIAREFK